MQIKFEITPKDVWKRQYRDWLLYPVRLTLYLCLLPLAAGGATYLNGLGSLFSAIVAVVVAIVPIAAFLIMTLDILRKLYRLKSQKAQVYVVQIGKFDLFYGTENSAGYFHHWTEFEDILDTPNSFSFVLRRREPLWVPKTAFAEPAYAEAFLSECRCQWQAAKDRAFFDIPHDETVWPPAPRSRA